MEIVKSGSPANIEAYDASEKERHTLTFECPRCKCVFKMCTIDCDDVLRLDYDEDEKRFVCKCPECGHNRSVDVTSAQLFLVPISPGQDYIMETTMRMVGVEMDTVKKNIENLFGEE